LYNVRTRLESRRRPRAPASPASQVRATLLCPTSFGADGALRQTGKVLRRLPVEQHAPVPSLLWAAGFSFGRAAPWRELVPYDPRLLDLFFGEEPSTAARLWTHGFDCFAPPEAKPSAREALAALADQKRNAEANVRAAPYLKRTHTHSRTSPATRKHFFNSL
jgi:hypothetical protein